MAGAIMNKVWDLFGMDTERDAEEVEEKTYDNNDYDTYDGYDEEENDEIEDRRIFGKRNKEKVVSMPQTQQIKMVISQPTTFDQSEEICEFLKEKNPEDENVEKANIQMNFLGLDLSKIPQQNMSDYTVYIIPILYILSSFISIRMTTAMQEKQNKKKQEEKEVKIDGTTGQELVPQEENNEMDAVMQTNKMMSWMMPIMSISIAFVAPLGLALYWLVSNILMIAERLILDKIIK